MKYEELKKAIDSALYDERNGFYSQLLAYIQAYSGTDAQKIQLSAIKAQALKEVLILCCGAISETSGYRLVRGGFKEYKEESFLPALHQKLIELSPVPYEALQASVDQLKALFQHEPLSKGDQNTRNRFVKQMEFLKSRSNLKTMFQFMNKFFVAMMFTDRMVGPDEVFRKVLDDHLNRRYRHDPLPDIEEIRSTLKKRSPTLAGSPSSFSSLSTLTDYEGSSFLTQSLHRGASALSNEDSEGEFPETGVNSEAGRTVLSFDQFMAMTRSRASEDNEDCEGEFPKIDVNSEAAPTVLSFDQFQDITRSRASVQYPPVSIDTTLSHRSDKASIAEDSQPAAMTTSTVSVEQDLLAQLAAKEQQNQALLAKIALLESQSVTPVPTATVTPVVEVSAVLDPPPELTIRDLLDLYRTDEGFAPIAHFDEAGQFRMDSERLRKILTAIDPRGSIAYADIQDTNVKIVSYLTGFNSEINRFAVSNGKAVFIGALKRAFEEWQRTYAAPIEAAVNSAGKLVTKSSNVLPADLTTETNEAVGEVHTAAEKRKNLQALLELYLEPNFLTAHLEQEAGKTVDDKEAFLSPDALEIYAQQANGHQPPMIHFDPAGNCLFNQARLGAFIDKLTIAESSKLHFSVRMTEYADQLAQDKDVSAFLDKTHALLRKTIKNYMTNIDVEVSFWVAMKGARSAWQVKHRDVLVSGKVLRQEPATIRETSPVPYALFKSSSAKSLDKLTVISAAKPTVEQISEQKVAVQSGGPSRRGSISRPVAASVDSLAVMRVKQLYQSVAFDRNGYFHVNEAALKEVLSAIDPAHDAEATLAAVRSISTPLDRVLALKQIVETLISEHAEKFDLKASLQKEHADWTKLHRSQLLVQSLCRFDHHGQFMGVPQPAELAKYLDLMMGYTGKKEAASLYNDLHSDQEILNHQGVMAFIAAMQTRINTLLQKTYPSKDKPYINELDKAFQVWRDHYENPVMSTAHAETSTEKSNRLPKDVTHEVDGQRLHGLRSAQLAELELSRPLPND